VSRPRERSTAGPVSANALARLTNPAMYLYAVPAFCVFEKCVFSGVGTVPRRRGAPPGIRGHPPAFGAETGPEFPRHKTSPGAAGRGARAGGAPRRGRGSSATRACECRAAKAK